VWKKALLLACACVFGGVSMGASSCGTTTTSEPDKKESNSGPAASPKAGLGDSITLKGSDTKMRVTVTKVVDPLPAPEFQEPDHGKRYVGVYVKLRNVGSTTYDDSPSNGATLITSGDEQADSTLLEGGDCSSDFASSAKISPGSQEQGCIAFQIKRSKRPRRFQFGLDSGFGPQTGEWSLR
jgi:hypothetical protein